MARRRSARRGSHRRKGSSLGKKLLIALALTIPVLYVVFTKLVFDPFEAPVPPFRLLVPRDVDVYVQRESLASDFEAVPGGTPVPTIVQRWMRTLQWRDFAATEWAAERGLPATAQELLAPLDELTAVDAGPVDVMRDLVGNELAFIGRDPWTAGRFAFLARLSARGKVAVEAFGIDAALDVEGPLRGAVRSEVTDDQVPDVHWFELAMADGGTWAYQRVNDLLVVGNDATLVRDVLRTVNGGQELSLGLSRLFRDNVAPPSQPVSQRLSLELALDVQNLVTAYDLEPDLERRRNDAVANVLPRLLDVSLMREAVGRLEVDKRRIDLDALIDVETLSAGARQGGLQGADTFAVHERLERAMQLMPAGTAYVHSMNVDLSKFLKSVIDGLDPELVKLLNESIRDIQRWNPSWGVQNVSQLIAELDLALGGQVTIGARRLDHEIPAGAQPIPTLAFTLPVRNLNAWESIAQALINGHSVLGVDGDAMWQQVYGGLGTHKFLPLPATSAEGLSFIVLEGETLVLSTDPDMTAEIIEAYGGGRALASQPEALDLIEAYRRRDTRANVASWVDLREFQALVEPYGEWLADQDTTINFVAERQRLADDLLRREHGGADLTTLPQATQKEINGRLDQVLSERERTRLEVEVPELARRWREGLSWMTLLRQATVALRLGEETLGIGLHLETVVD